MAEFIQGKPIFPGKTEPEQIKLIFKVQLEFTDLNRVIQHFKELGTPDDTKWPGFSELPHAKKASRVFSLKNLNSRKFTLKILKPMKRSIGRGIHIINCVKDSKTKLPKLAMI